MSRVPFLRLLRLRLAHLTAILQVITIVALAGLAPVAAQTPEATPRNCQPTLEAIAPGSADYPLVSNEVARTYRVYVPPSYEPTTAFPVLLSLHGFTSNAEQQELLTGWNAIADTESFLAVYPQGLATFPFPARWNYGRNPFVPNDTVDDVLYISDLLDDLATRFCVDPHRVYVTGFSAGAGMTHRLACELSDRIAAIGGVSGAYGEAPNGCEPDRPVPAIGFHGTADVVSRPAGDTQMSLTAPATVFAGWADRNGCNAGPVTLPQTANLQGVRYMNCTDDAEVVFYMVQGGQHAWGEGISQIIWEFVSRYSLP